MVGLPDEDALGPEGRTREVGYLAGSFDMLNVAHLDVIGQAGARCDELVLGVFADEQIIELTGRPPVVPLAERAALVSHVRGVTRVVVHDAGPSADPGAVRRFVMAGEQGVDLVGAEALVPGRQTTSAILLAALGVTSQQDVAS